MWSENVDLWEMLLDFWVDKLEGILFVCHRFNTNCHIVSLQRARLLTKTDNVQELSIF